MKNRVLANSAFLLFAVVLVTGCGTTATQTSYFAAYNSDTKNRNYYRVQVTAHTDDGKTSWQTGWYSRTALDEIFSEITTNGNPASDQMVDLYEKTLLDLFTHYTACLETNGLDQARKSKQSIDELIGAAGIYLSSGATAKDAAENAGKRYVYSFTADPTLLERMIADALNSDETSATLTGLVTANSPIGQQISQQNLQLSLSYGASKNMAERLQEAIDATSQGFSNFASLTAAQQAALIDRLTVLLNAAAASSE
jgi:hypothetical protein